MRGFNIIFLLQHKGPIIQYGLASQLRLRGVYIRSAKRLEATLGRPKYTCNNHVAYMLADFTANVTNKGHSNMADDHGAHVFGYMSAYEKGDG